MLCGLHRLEFRDEPKKDRKVSKGADGQRRHGAGEDRLVNRCGRREADAQGLGETK